MPNFDIPPRGRFRSVGLAVLLVLLLGVSAYSVSGLVRARQHTQELTASNETLNASLRQVQNQLQAVTDKLNALAAQPAPPAAQAPPTVQERPAVRVAPVHKRTARAADDPRWTQMQAKLADEQKQIDAARDETNQARKDLQDSLNSTRDDLNGSIARTHDEVALLQKRGERNYYEFQVDKSKQFHPAGPLSLSVRKVNVKQGYYDLVLVVDDRQLVKKHVNLYEPLMFTLADRPQPVELVVNQINNNQVKGYVSEPKYKKSELAAATAPAPTVAPNTDAKTLQRR